MALTPCTPSAKALDLSKKKGFTLTEIAIVLGIVGLILGSIWTAAASVYSNQRVAHAQTAVLQIAQAVRTLYSNQTNFGSAAAGTLITDSLRQAGAFPADLMASGVANLATGPFANGTTAIAVDAGNDGFIIAMSAVPQANCVSLISAVAGNTRDASLFLATGAANAVPTAAVLGILANGGPIANAVVPTQAATNCANALNNVEFGFGLR